MNFIKATAASLLTILVICSGQFLTPEQLREQHDIGYGARTHYEMSGSRRTDMFNRVNPDYLLRGFFPFWSVVLIALALLFLTISVLGLIGYLLGCRRPTPEELSAKEFEQSPAEDEVLLNGDSYRNPTDTKIPVNAYFDNYIPADFRYDSSPPVEQRTRIGQSDEDMV